MNKDATKIRISVIVIIMAVLAIAITVGVFGLKSYVQESIHEERTIYLKAQTETTANLVNEMIAGHMEYAAVCANLISKELKNGDNVSEFLNRLQEKLYRDDVRLILVDEKTTWYGENDSTGKITATTYYGSETPKEVLYMTKGVDSDVESMVYRVRLDEPVMVETQMGTALIEYCSIIYYMDSFRDDLKAAFPYECNSFIVDEDGLMIYKDFLITRLVDGTNLFSKYPKVEFLYGDTGEELVKRLMDGEIVIGEFLLDNENYFICTAPLNVNNWYVSFVLNAEQLASGTYINLLTMYMGIIGMLVSIMVIIAALAILIGQNNKNRLESEKKANEMLEKASNAKGVFISNMSHDIRTPINGIMGMTTLAQMEDDPAKTREYLKKIDTSSKYLLSLVNDVLDMSLIESGRLVISESPLEVKGFIDDCAAIVSGQTLEKDITLTVDHSGVEHGRIMADEVHLRQVMINILGNACKFTPAQGHILFKCTEVTSDEKTVRLCFEIKDDGIGMSEEFMKDIWMRFTQERDDSRKENAGTGLGMAITKNIVDAMGGDITVESRLGEGSCFKVEIDFEIDEAGDGRKSRIEGADSEDTGNPLDKKIRVLLAEDNSMNMEIATELLKMRGIEVEPAEDGAIAVEKFTASAPGTYDLIFMDVMMPVMDGLEACRAIRDSGREDSKTIPIIAMTANYSGNDIRLAEEAGMNDYVGKPIITEKLYNVIYRYCEKEGMGDEE